MNDDQSNGTRYRLQELERRVGSLENRTEPVPVLRVEMDGLRRELKDIADEVSSLRRALYTAALSVTGGAVIFAVTILQVLH